MVGEELGSYRVIAPLGKGGMASVYVGEHKVLGHKVAIKILHPKHLSNESIERRFFNEAKAIASIRHPSVVELFDFGRADDGRAYIVMELLEGESLRGRIRTGIMDQKASATFARQIASGLAKAHERGIVHRDLKPDNVFLVRDPEVALGERAKVLDFGIAKHTDFGGPVSEHTATGILVGTPAYMSPEQCRGTGTVDARSDIYSLGVVLYRMVTNQLPFEAAGTGELIGKHLYVDPKSAQEINPLLSDEMDAVIQMCLQKDPADRYQSMDEVAQALADARLSILEADERVTPSPLPGALAAKPRHTFTPVGSSSPAVNSPSVPPVLGKAVPAARVAPEELATEIQVTPSPMQISAAIVPAAQTAVRVRGALDEETSPTTLRHATGEASRAEYVIANPNRRIAMVALGVVAVVAVVAIAFSDGDDASGVSAAGASISDRSPSDEDSGDSPTDDTAIGDSATQNTAAENTATDDDQSEAATAAAKARADELAAAEAAAKAKNEERARKAAETAKKDADALALAEAERKAASEKAKQDAEARALERAKARKEAEAKAKKDAEEKARADARAENSDAKKLAAAQKAIADKARKDKARAAKKDRTKPKRDKKKSPKDDKRDKFKTKPVF